ncbi:MAG: EAL domain-containing protein [Alphaproteobacteria bacterium]
MTESNARVLIVDDDPDVAALVASVATDRGFECHTVDQSTKIFEAIGRFAPHLIILDLVMPNLDGVQVLRHLAEIGCRAGIILLSGVDPRALNAAAHLGETHGLKIRAFLKKPFEIRALEKALGSAPARRPTISEAQLREAIAAGQVVAAYQPKVDFSCTSSRCIQGFEALARWEHPEFGTIPPSKFIPLAEQTGLIEPLTFGIVRQALDQAALLKKRGFMLDVAVNLSGRLLSMQSLPDQFGELVRKAELEVGRLAIELTESVTMADPVAAMENMTRFRLKGFKLSMDDYGTGYSSLVRLYRMPFSELKIDRSFVQELDTNEESRVIVRSIVDLAHNLGLKACAEGVETTGAWDFLSTIGCDQAQGHLISPPLSASEFTRFVEQHATNENNAPAARPVRAGEAYKHAG